MKTFFYHTSQLLPARLDDAWRFFSSAKNLACITPPELDFTVLTQLPEGEIYEGMIIDYRVRPLFGIPVHWQTEIAKVDKPFMFTDRQLSGPYHKWEHTHIFEPKDNGLLMKDEVVYQLPLGIIGTIAHAIVVRKKLEQIFDFRRKTLIKIFEGNGNFVN
ncbi:MAG: SRPBCC family protein [Flavisolibacter sp.]|jgi:ligand-binding SRPBCC domain-containing protein